MEPYGKGDGRVRWVTPEWLMENMEDVAIIDCQPNIHDYILEHIPGAVYLNEGLFREPRGKAPAMYIPEGAVELIFQQAGIENRPTVVYTGTGGVKGGVMVSSRPWWPTALQGLAMKTFWYSMADSQSGRGPVEN